MSWLSSGHVPSGKESQSRGRFLATSSSSELANALNRVHHHSRTITKSIRWGTREGSQHRNNDAQCRHCFKKAQHDTPSSQVRDNFKNWHGYVQHLGRSRAYKLPSCQNGWLPAGHRPAAVHIPRLSFPLSLDFLAAAGVCSPTMRDIRPDPCDAPQVIRRLPWIAGSSSDLEAERA